MSLTPPGRVDTAPLFPELLRGLLELLSGLEPGQWEQPTVCGDWDVKAVALHLLGGEVGLLSRRRDAFTPPGGPEGFAGWDDLVAFIDELNHSWVRAARRLSPPLLVDLLGHLGRQTCTYVAGLDPEAPGDVVAWAGQEPAPIWLEVAREYTERWHHQQQIRDAVGRPGLREPRHLGPVIAAFVRALPRTLRDREAPLDTAVTLRVDGAAGGSWTCVREDGGWTLWSGSPGRASAELVLPEDVAWRLFTKGLRPEEAGARGRATGDADLARALLRTVSIIG
jgi:uncharacterized protein (TIGR03083 family)